MNRKEEVSSEKRLFLAIALCFIVLLIYPYIMNSLFPAPPAPPAEEKKAAVATTTENTKKSEASNAIEITKEETPVIESVSRVETPVIKAPVKIVKVETPLYKAEISTKGGGLVSFKLKKYKEEQKEGSDLINIVTPVKVRSGEKNTIDTAISMSGFKEELFFTPSADFIKVGTDAKKTLTLTAVTAAGLNVTKTYVFTSEDYFLDTSIKLENNGSHPVRGTLENTITRKLDTEADVYFHKGGIVYDDDEADRIDLDEEKSGKARVQWLGVEDKYFLLAFIPSEETYIEKWHLYSEDETSASADVFTLFDLSPGTKEEIKLTAFVGPKEYRNLKDLDPKLGLVDSIEFGWLSGIAKPVLTGINIFYGFTGNYGIAIILLTIVIKILFYPLTKMSFVSMKKMREVMPQMQTIRERYKHDKQKMNMELMDFYKRNKVNPFAGCLPMLLQIPVFIALYEALLAAIELRHAPFMFWITDLSAKDPYFITPILMGASMFVQQKMTPSTLDPIQQKVMLFMPVVLTVVFVTFPSGLVIYWLVNNLITIGQMWHINKD